MEYNLLGATGLQVSALGFGASPLGNEFGDVDPAEATETVLRAIDLGINYFDVAPYYGRTLAEQRLGVALKGHRDQIVLATKVGRYGKEAGSGFNFSAERVRVSVEESLRRLQTDYIDVVQVHDVEYGDKQTILSDTIPALLDLKAEGKIGFVGVTGYPLTLLADFISEAPVDTVLSYCHFTLLNTTLKDSLLPVALENDTGVINAAPLHMGVLTHQGPPDWHPAPEEVLVTAKEVARLAAQRGYSLPSLALQFALSEKEIDTTVVGMGSVAELDANVTAAAGTPPQDLLEEIEALIAPVKNINWREQGVNYWDEGSVPVA